MTIPADLKYTESHEWIRTEPDGTLTIGITDHAQDALGDLVFIELPEVGRTVSAKENCVVLESVKAASDAYAPVAGEIIAVNTPLTDSPETLNSEPYESWLFKLKPAADSTTGGLLNASDYAISIGET
ncbi:MAG: glycine cleavage system protein GcvH [Burkholderiales bacterium]|nr:glycine cleavage system protein GcvH [Burkholderiales bacterium]